MSVCFRTGCCRLCCPFTISRCRLRAGLLFSFFIYPDNAVAVILRPSFAKIRTSILSVYPLFRSAFSSGSTARTIPPTMYEAGCCGGSFAFSLRNARSSSTLCDESACTLRRASFFIHKHGNPFTFMLSNVYDDYSEETGKRHDEVGAVHTDPCGVRASTTISPIRLRLLGEMVAHLAQGFAPRPHDIFGDRSCQDPKEHAMSRHESTFVSRTKKRQHSSYKRTELRSHSANTFAALLWAYASDHEYTRMQSRI